MQKIVTFLWFDKQASEAAKFYCSVFKNSKMINDHPLVVTFELNGQKFMALNGGPQFKFTEAISLLIECETQDEVDHYWNTLSGNGGSESQCGWLKDKYGLSWQVVPTVVGKLMSGEPEKAQRAMQALLKMKKLDIAVLQNAYDGK